MKRIILIISLIVNCNLIQAKTIDHVMVITHQNSSVNSISRSQLRNLYMGNPSLANMTPILLPHGEIARSIFNVRILGLTESRIQAYWAQMRFSGRQRRPQTAKSIEELILMIASSKNTIGYVPEDTLLPAGIKVIYRTSNH